MAAEQNYAAYPADFVGNSNSNQNSQFIQVPAPAQKQLAITTTSGNKYTQMRPIAAIRIFAVFSIVLGICSAAVQIAALLVVIVPLIGFDIIGHGIWAGLFYVISGGLSLGAASKKTKGLIISSIVMASISIAAAATAFVLSGITLILYWYTRTWYILEWTLFGTSIAAFCNSIVLMILMSVGLCTGRPKVKNNNEIRDQPADSFVVAAPYFQQHALQPYMGNVSSGYQTVEMPMLLEGRQVVMPVMLQPFTPSGAIIQPPVVRYTEHTQVPVNVPGESIVPSAPLPDETIVAADRAPEKYSAAEIVGSVASTTACDESKSEQTKEIIDASERTELYPISLMKTVKQ